MPLLLLAASESQVFGIMATSQDHQRAVAILVETIGSTAATKQDDQTAAATIIESFGLRGITKQDRQTVAAVGYSSVLGTMATSQDHQTAKAVLSESEAILFNLPIQTTVAVMILPPGPVQYP